MRLPVECITAPASSLRRAVLSLLPGALSRLALSEAEGSKRAWPGVRYGGGGAGGGGRLRGFGGGRGRGGGPGADGSRGRPARPAAISGIVEAGPDPFP